MKLYKKAKLIALRVNDLMDMRLKMMSEYLELDRADMIRMFISNALKYWEAEKTKDNLQKKYEAQDHSYTNEDIKFIADKEIKTLLANERNYPQEKTKLKSPEKFQQPVKK
jgi:hypothetical protein